METNNSSRLERVFSVLYKIQSFCNISLVLGVALLVVTQVFMRYVLQSPLMGIEEVLLFPTIWLYMLGGASASYEGSHIECGILTLYIKRTSTMRLFNVAKTAISSVIGSWLLYWAWWYFSYALRVKKTSALLHIPLLIAQSALFVGLLLMVVYALFECAQHVKRLFDGENAVRKTGEISEEAPC